MNNSEQRSVAFQIDPFLMSLTEEGSTWWGRAPTDILVIAACAGSVRPDWAAYYENPQHGSHRVREYGNKIPEEAARRLFPGKPWSDLRYRR